MKNSKNENEILMYCNNRVFTGRTLLLYKLIEYNRTIIGMENIITGNAMKI